MKHIYRKPWLPCLLVMLTVFSACFMAWFQKSIEQDLAAVENIYDTVQLTFQVLPGTASNGVLELRNSEADKLKAVEGIAQWYQYLQCPYSLREPYAMADIGTVYGTNDPVLLAEQKGLVVEYGQGWDAQRLLTDRQQGIPCLMDASFQDFLGLEIGQSFVIAGNPGESEDIPAAPSINMVLAGTYMDTRGLTEALSLITTDELFAANPGLLYSGDMMASHYYYRAMHLHLDPAYNRDYQRISDKLKETVADGGDFVLYSNVRMLNQAVRPMEQKITIQKALVLPLCMTLWVVLAVVSTLLSLSFSQEVFLRLLWGERRLTVLVKTLLPIGVVLLCGVALALCAVWFAAGVAWLGSALRFLAGGAGLCFAAAAVPQTVNCGTNLVRLYQKREA